jgi:DNA polymerase III sliding clamp (beta) subunit (PCNA family)
MKIKVDRVALYHATRLLAPFCGSSVKGYITRSLRFSTHINVQNEGQVILRATDIETWAEVMLPADVLEPGDCAIAPGEKYRLVAALRGKPWSPPARPQKEADNEDNVDAEQKARESQKEAQDDETMAKIAQEATDVTLQVNDKRAKLIMPVGPRDKATTELDARWDLGQWPATPRDVFAECPEVTILAADLERAIRLSCAATGKFRGDDKGGHFSRCVILAIGPDGLHFAGYDGASLHAVSFPWATAPGLMVVSVYASSLRSLLTTIGFAQRGAPEAEAKVAIARTHIRVNVGNVRFTIRNSEARPSTWQALAPIAADPTLAGWAIPRREFLHCVRMARTIQAAGDRDLRIRRSPISLGGEVRIYAHSQGHAASILLPWPYNQPEDLDVRLDGKDLLAYLAVVDREIVEVCLCPNDVVIKGGPGVVGCFRLRAASEVPREEI